MSLDSLRLRRIVRALIRQRGGAMITTLPECGAALRVECTLHEGCATLSVAGEGCAPLGRIAEAHAAIEAECARVGMRLAELAWSDPLEASDASAPRTIDSTARCELPRAA